MRTLIWTSFFMLTAGTLCGCSNTGAAPTTQAANPIDTKSWVMQSDGNNVLKLSTPADVTCKSKDGMLDISAPQYVAEVWLVPGAKTVDDAAANIGPQIISEFKDFKADKTTDLTIAGSPARQMIGTGHEADDGDNGTADVVIFKIGDHIFVACYHGEYITAPGQQAMLSLVQSAQLP